MANKPEGFSQDEIRRKKIRPEVLDSWVLYVRKQKYEALKKAGEKIQSEEDISITVNLNCQKIDMVNTNNIKATISVKTERPGGFISWYPIALFVSSFDAKESFEEYTKYKKGNLSLKVGETEISGSLPVTLS